MPTNTNLPNTGSSSSISRDYLPNDRTADIFHDERYVRDRLDEQVCEMDRLSEKNQNRYKRLKRTAIIIGATIPLFVSLTALDIVNQDEYRWIKVSLLLYAAFGGTFLALMKNLLSSGNFYDNWKYYRSLAEALLREKYLYLTKMPPYHMHDAYPLMVEKVEEILEEEEDRVNRKFKASSNE